MIPIHADSFWHEGRGPELLRLHWDASGTILRGADYHNPDWGSTSPVRRVRFIRAQVAMITPEEVIDYAALGPLLATHRPAAMFDLGAAGNVEAPAWLELLARGYRVQAGPGQWIAAGTLGRFIGSGPLDLLGLVALAESRGSQWQASDAEIEAFLRETSLDEEKK